MSLELDFTGKSFTKPWFIRSKDIFNFEEYIYPRFVEKPILYLEVGVFEGMSMCWMFQNVLTHPKSRAVGIDPWLMMARIGGEEEMEKTYQRARTNLKEWSDRCTLVRATSDMALKMMISRSRGIVGVKKKSVDLCFIDGSHTPLQVLDDAMSVYQLMKNGGMMLFDDVDGVPNQVEEGLRMFIREVKKGVSLLWKNHTMECYLKCQN
jgi:predicted O-methyltransferase YrrM